MEDVRFGEGGTAESNKMNAEIKARGYNAICLKCGEGCRVSGDAGLKTPVRIICPLQHTAEFERIRQEREAR